MKNDELSMTNDKIMTNGKFKLISLFEFGSWKLLAITLLILISFFSSAFAADLIVVDPMYIGVGARPLGMGKAYVAVAEDADALFVNPAGIAKAGVPKLTSMFSNVMGDVNYMVVGGVYPQTANSAVGAGAVLTTVPGIDLRDTTGTSLGSANWNSSVLFLSYGLNLEEQKVGLGGSVKYISQGGSGGTTNTAASTGLGLDVGALYSPTDNISLGVSLQNPISTKMTSGNSVDNTIQSNLKVGGAYKTRIGDSQKLILAADMDIPKTGSSAMHLGAEYQVTPNISLRGGLDDNNITAGIGLTTGGVQFNYAYHPYTAIAENATHYFSVSYVGTERSLEEAALTIALKEPADKAVIYTDNVAVQGVAKGAAFVTVNGISVPVDKTGAFSAAVPMSKVGKKLIQVEAKTINGKTAVASRKVLRLVTFADVPEGFWAKQPIEGSGTIGLVQGYPDGTFRPGRVLTRAEIATLLIRAKGTEIKSRPTAAVFKDVKPDFWASAYIKEAVNMGVLKGYPDGKFRPNKRISKAETITVLARYDAMPLNPVASKPFNDVPLKHWSARYIQAAKDSGMLSYIEGGNLGLNRDVSRAETVEMMSKTSVAANLLKELYSWEKGFPEPSAPSLKASL